MRNNYDMQVALKNIEAAQLVLKQSKLGYLPEVKPAGWLPVSAGHQIIV